MERIPQFKERKIMPTYWISEISKYTVKDQEIMGYVKHMIQEILFVNICFIKFKKREIE